MFFIHGVKLKIQIHMQRMNPKNRIHLLFSLEFICFRIAASVFEPNGISFARCENNYSLFCCQLIDSLYFSEALISSCAYLTADSSAFTEPIILASSVLRSSSPSCISDEWVSPFFIVFSTKK